MTVSCTVLMALWWFGFANGQTGVPFFTGKNVARDDKVQFFDAFTQTEASNAKQEIKSPHFLLQGHAESGAVSLRDVMPSDVDVQTIDMEKWQRLGKDPLVNMDLLYMFEQLIGNAYHKNIADKDISEVVRKWLGQFIPSASVEQTQKLLSQYLEYRSANLNMKITPNSTDALATLKEVIAERKRLQNQYFSPLEVQSLFGDANRLQDYQAAKLEIMQSTQLDASAKAQNISAAQQNLLTPEQQNSLSTISLPYVMAQQNAAFDKAGASEQERYAVRSPIYGEAAAMRMAEVDKSQAEWNQKIALYAQTAPHLQAEMKARLFTPAEQQRLEGAVVLYKSTH